MVRKVEYFECDCVKGKLEEIASTDGESHRPGESYRHTEYFGCNACGALFQRYVRHPAIGDSNEWKPGEFRAYAGKVIREEISLPNMFREGLARSVVIIKDNDKQTRLNINYSLLDHNVAVAINSAETSAVDRFIRPELPQFKHICDAILRLQSPYVFQASASKPFFGRMAVWEALKGTIESASAGNFAYIFRQNLLTRSELYKPTLYIAEDIVFSKEDITLGKADK